MAQIDISRSYADGEVLTEADLDAAFDDVETFLNTTKINDDNIQNSGITGSTKLLNSSVTAAKLAADSVTTLKIAAQNVTTAKIADDAITLDKLADAVMEKLLPSGTIIAYGDTSAPTGWLYCDGTAVSRTTYATLFGVIGVKFGQGDNSTTFNLPDFRGRFLRGFNDGEATDPDASSRTAMNTGGASGDAIGSVQGYATARPASTAFTTSSDGVHNHIFNFRNGITGTGQVLASDGHLGTTTTPDQSAVTSIGDNGGHTHTVASGGDNETRPKNASVAYMIKY